MIEAGMIETTLAVIFILVLVPAWILYSFSRWAANSKGLAGHEIEKARRERRELLIESIEEVDALLDGGTIGIDKASGFSDSCAGTRYPHDPRTCEICRMTAHMQDPIVDPNKDAADVAGSDWGEL
jgi:hypothetical protein